MRIELLNKTTAKGHYRVPDMSLHDPYVLFCQHTLAQDPRVCSAVKGKKKGGKDAETLWAPCDKVSYRPINVTCSANTQLFSTAGYLCLIIAVEPEDSVVVRDSEDSGI